MNVLVIAPHPDDETIGCGGALSLHAQRRERTVVVFLSSGGVGAKPLPQQEAWAIREREAMAAAKILGMAKIHLLRQPDWLLSEHIEETADALRPLLAAEQPELIYLPHQADGHPDHQ